MNDDNGYDRQDEDWSQLAGLPWFILFLVVCIFGHDLFAIVLTLMSPTP